MKTKMPRETSEKILALEKAMDDLMNKKEGPIADAAHDFGLFFAYWIHEKERIKDDRIIRGRLSDFIKGYSLGMAAAAVLLMDGIVDIKIMDVELKEGTADGKKEEADPKRR